MRWSERCASGGTASVSRALLSGGNVREHTGEVAFAHEHVDKAAGSRVADAQAALDERDRGGLRLHDDLDCALEEWILVWIEVLLLPAVLLDAGRLEQRLVELLSALRAALLHDERNFLLAHVRALHIPVMTSTEGRWVASTRWIPTARDFCASRMTASSTSCGETIIMSASSSMTMRRYGSVFSPRSVSTRLSSPRLRARAMLMRS